MKFTITGKKLEVSEELRAYAEKKVGKIERLFRSGDSEAFITFSRERGRYTAEVTLKNNGMFYRVSETTGDMFASIDSACASIERQIRKNKTRLAKGLRSDAIVPEVPEEFDIHEEREFDIVRTKRFTVKPMSVEEAILQMNLLGHSFFVFRNTDDDNAICVVYTRNSGGYGIIETGEAD